MAAISKFYFHDAASTLGGTLPSNSGTFRTASQGIAAGATTNRTMDGTIGSGQTSASLTTAATTGANVNWFRKFLSAELAAQTINLTGQTVTISLAASESNANSDMFEIGSLSFGVWRPSTGAIVSTLALNPVIPLNEPGTSQTACSGNSSALTTSAVCLDGDILVVEIWTSQQQAMGVAYTNTIFYDGATEASTTDCASFISFSTPIQMFEPPQVPFFKPYRQIIPH